MGNNQPDKILNNRNLNQIDHIKYANKDFYRKKNSIDTNSLIGDKMIQLYNEQDEQQIIVKEFLFSDQNIFKAKKSVLDQLRGETENVGLVCLNEMIVNQDFNLCSQTYKLHVIYYSDSHKTLQQEIEERNQTSSFYEEQELTQLLENLVKSVNRLDQISRNNQNYTFEYNILFQNYQPSGILSGMTYRVMPIILESDDTLNYYQKQLQYKQVYKNPDKLISKLGFIGPHLISNFNSEIYCPNYETVLKNEFFAIGMTILSAMLLENSLQKQIYSISQGKQSIVRSIQNVRYLFRVFLECLETVDKLGLENRIIHSSQQNQSSETDVESQTQPILDYLFKPLNTFIKHH